MILTLLILKSVMVIQEKKNNCICHIFIFNFSSVTTIYHNSNYWVGDNVLNKVYNNLNIREVNKIDPEAISKLVNKIRDAINR